MPKRRRTRHTSATVPASSQFRSHRDAQFASNPLRLYRPKRVAEIFDIDLSTVWRWQQDGILPPPTKITSKVKGWTEAQLMKVRKLREATNVR